MLFKDVPCTAPSTPRCPRTGREVVPKQPVRQHEAATATAVPGTQLGVNWGSCSLPSPSPSLGRGPQTSLLHPAEGQQQQRERECSL